MLPRILCLCAVLVTTVWGADARKGRGDGEQHDPPDHEAPWFDDSTGFALPQKLGTFVMEGWFEWADKDLGSSVRYTDRKAQARVDVYVYPCAAPSATEEEQRGAISAELNESVSGVYAAAKSGIYSNVSHQDGKIEELKLLPDGSTHYAWSFAFMDIRDEDTAGGSVDRVVSWHCVTTLKGRFIKVRYTYPASRGKEGEDLLNEFVKAWEWCVRDPQWREAIARDLKTYLADPLGKNAAEPAAAVVMYAEKSPLVSMAVTERFSACLAKAAKARPGSELDLLRAFIAGGTDACLRREPQAAPATAAAACVKVYQLLQKQSPDFQIAELDELAAAVKSGRAAEWLQGKGSK